MGVDARSLRPQRKRRAVRLGRLGRRRAVRLGRRRAGAPAVFATLVPPGEPNRLTLATTRPPPSTLHGMTRLAPTARSTTWLSRWGGIMPLLLAEFVVWLGFGGLLPVLPLYFTDQGVDLATLGVVIAAWPAARLVGEPIFGWLADRTARVPLMVVGLLLAGVFSVLPLALTGPLAFIALRAAAGLATAIYDPAARGYLTDATPPERRGEAFGLYGAAQMGGLLLGPAIGAIGADRLGGIGFVFVFGGIAAVLAAIPIALLGRESGTRTHPAPSLDSTEFPPDSPSTSRRKSVV